MLAELRACVALVGIIALNGTKLHSLVLLSKSFLLIKVRDVDGSGPRTPWDFISSSHGRHGLLCAKVRSFWDL